MKRKIIFFTLLFSIFCGLSAENSALTAARKYEAEKNYVYALASYYDAYQVEDTEEIASEFQRLADFILYENLGIPEENIFDTYDAWVSLAKNYEKYWTENCPVDFKLCRNKKSIDFKSRSYTYNFRVYTNTTDKYRKLSRIIVSGFDRASLPEWDMPEWPGISYYKDSESLLPEGVPLVKWKIIKPWDVDNFSTPAWYFGSDFDIPPIFDITFNINDSKGNVLLKSGRYITGADYPLVIKNVSQEVADILDSGDYTLSLTGVYLQYGDLSKFDINELVEKIEKDTTRSWLKQLPEVAYNVKNIKLLAEYENYKEDENPYPNFTIKQKTIKSSNGGKVLNIYVWNDEFSDRFNTYYASKLPADVKVNFIQTPNQDNAYQWNLDDVLLMQENAKADDRIDLFLVEADYALKYVNTPYTLDVKKDIGLTDADLANQFKYTKDIMTDSNGNLKGVSWQACPGGFIYRRSYAKEVLGSDDPSVVQSYIDSWEKFDAVAARMKKSGYFMLSGYDDAFRVFYDNIKHPLVNSDRKIVIDDSLKYWVKQTKEYTDKGYNNKASLWSWESTHGMMENGKVFGYFAPAWFYDFCMPHDEGSAFGDWAFCKGPQGFNWGGTWLCAAAGTDNLSLIKDIFYTLTCDADVMENIAIEKGDFANNLTAMQKIAAYNYKNDFLGSENPIPWHIESAESVHKNNITVYDQGIIEKLQLAMKDYFEGYITEEEAWDNFYNSVIELYPSLSRY